VDAADRALVGQLLAPTGELLWVDDEAALDAVTAMSGSGPAYVFYFIEAMTEAGMEMGLSPDQAQRLAIGTFTGASALAHSATEPPSVLRDSGRSPIAYSSGTGTHVPGVAGSSGNSWR